MRIVLSLLAVALPLIATAEVRVVKDRELPVVKAGPALGKRGRAHDAGVAALRRLGAHG